VADNSNKKVVKFDLLYRKYKRMWIEDRWKFSGDLVRLTVKQNKSGLGNIEQYTLDTINRVVAENDNNWLDGYEYTEGVLRQKKR